MSMAVETLGYFLGALGLLMLGVTLPHSQWRVSTIHGSVITTNTIFENLWYSCATDSLGVYNCREFPSMLALSGTGVWGTPGVRAPWHACGHPALCPSVHKAARLYWFSCLPFSTGPVSGDCVVNLGSHWVDWGFWAGPA